VQVVLSRYQGEKKISSLPYTLTVTTNGATTSVRMGAEIPIAMTVTQGGPVPVSSFNYRSIGTSIDCSAAALDDGRYYLHLTIEDSSIYPDDSATGADKIGSHPSFRSFKSDNSVYVSDGQSAQYTTATDKVTSEVVKVDVTMSVLR
jgi:Flp pilus assembly secretin CpaC